ncbi:methyltransferase domain-containing protein [Streptomyces sp. NPDC049837]|uniref:methyltransferase domain-containing protein n=1 Tax=Streptomyces sp. NPDC049837 TaxID=3155277 RepID=UPI0034137A1A
MEEIRSYERSLARSRRSMTRDDRPRTFLLHGREWDLLDEVFAPPFSPSTEAAMELLGFPADFHRSGSFLEIGCGTGVIAVSAALAGCERVVAADINPHAVRNAAVNAGRHGVADRVRAVHSDLFAGLSAEERFDVVYWHSNFVLAPADHQYATLHDRAYVDPGYRTHHGYLSAATERLTPTGTALLHFSDRGDVETLTRIAGECGRKLRVAGSLKVEEGPETVEHILFEITAA